jgi:hypothetical protein
VILWPRERRWARQRMVAVASEPTPTLR